MKYRYSSGGVVQFTTKNTGKTHQEKKSNIHLRLDILMYDSSDTMVRYALSFLHEAPNKEIWRELASKDKSHWRLSMQLFALLVLNFFELNCIWEKCCQTVHGCGRRTKVGNYILQSIPKTLLLQPPVQYHSFYYRVRIKLQNKKGILKRGGGRAFLKWHCLICQTGNV